jgi:hypothetical protein
MTRRPNRPLDLAVLCRTPDGAFLVRDCRTGDVATVREVGRPLTDLEQHLCEEPRT